MDNMQEFWKKLNSGPAVLFIGQDYLSIETGEDPLLREVGNRFGYRATKPKYSQLLEGLGGDSDESGRPWISEFCRRILHPDWLKSVSNFPWSSVVASAIDPIWLPAFRNEWREVASIYDDGYFPRDPRNRRVLHATFLYGALNQSELRQRAPLSQFEFIGRQQVARNLAQRLPNVLTPFGVMAVEGYNGEDDWYTWEDFYALLQTLGTGQVHVFSVDEEKAQNPVFAELVRTGKLIAHSERLVRVLDRGIDQGFVQTDRLIDSTEGTRRVRVQNQVKYVPRDLWNRISNSGILLDEQILVPPQPVSDEALYWEFRRFLFESGTRPLWSGYPRGLAFEREFESILYQKVTGQLELESTTDQSIIVHGQTGTGKTVALGGLAYKIAELGKYPVIFIERKAQRPVEVDIDECCRWLENSGAAATLIVWDGMGQQADYHELQTFLASRGRKAVVVGSAYKINSLDDHLVEVPDRLSTGEAVAFAAFLEGLGIELSQQHRHDLSERDPSYLVALYRHLAAARPRITTGVIQELQQLEAELLTAVRNSQVSSVGLGSFASALVSAGLVGQSHAEDVTAGLDPQAVSKNVIDLVDLVTVPGRYGMNIPMELLARAWEQSNFELIAEVLRGCDLFQTFEDAAGRMIVGPRHPLEAQLVVQARIGSAEGEAGIICKIVRALRPSTWGSSDSDETSFIIETLRGVGPQSNERRRFAPYFRLLAESISEVRESRNLKNPRLMLQEANFLREWVTHKSQINERPLDVEQVLAESQEILQNALDQLEDNPRQWRLRTFIATELAANLGTATVDSIRIGSAGQSIRLAFEEVLRSVQAAREIDFSSYNPVDVLAWTTEELAKPGIVDDQTRLEAIVSLLDALETVDEELLDGRNKEQFQSRRLEVGQLLGDEVMSDSAFQRLISMGSTAGYYVRAKEFTKLEGQEGSEKVTINHGYRQSWQYLEGFRDQIKDDPRCLGLLLSNWWQSRTGHRLFTDERIAVPLSLGDWEYSLQLVRQLRGLGSHRDLALALLEAISLFHLDRFAAALQLFREVEAESYRVPGRRRILRSLLASEPNGEPKLYHGDVRTIEPGRNRAQVFVEEIGQRLVFLPHDFGRPDIRQGDSLGEFHIAFNFIGPVPDPVVRYRTQR